MSDADLMRRGCDCHAHIFPPADRFARRHVPSYPVPDAPVDAYLAGLNGAGLARGVLVQPAVYGDDPTALMAAIAGAPDRLRGVAVAGPETPFDVLADWNRRGIRALRFVDRLDPFGRPYPGAVPSDRLPELAESMRRLQWHAQLWGTIDDVLVAVRKYRDLALPFVVDHLAQIDVRKAVDHADFQELVELARAGHVHLKLTICRLGPITAEAIFPFVRRLLDAVPEQLIWGSDWPFLRLEKAASLSIEQQLGDVHAWTDDIGLRKAVLADNPERLYGFGQPPRTENGA